jgi:hypothetical protein
MKYIINNTGIVFFVNGKPIKIEKSSAQYARVIRIFDLPENEQEEALEKALETNLNQDGFEINGSEVSYKGELLPEVLSSKIFSLIKEGLPVSLFAKFWENLKQNPSSSSVRELYDFLAYKELPLTEDGCFLAYKGLCEDYWSVSGNTKTKVSKGQVDKGGRILNKIGEEIEVVRHDVDDNRNHHCSFGLHVGSLDYASDFSRGKIVVVKVNPKNVVSVPQDYNCQKCRVSAYKVVSDFSKEISCSATSEDGEDLISEDVSERNVFVDRVESYLLKKKSQGITSLSVQQIQNSFSPDYPSRNRVLDAVNELGYIWDSCKSPVVFL